MFFGVGIFVRFKLLVGARGKFGVRGGVWGERGEMAFLVRFS